LNTFGYHLANMALHALAAFLVWRVLVQLRVPGAMFAAALFALHPVNVESVAWIAQLKNILSLLFALVSTLFYVRYSERGGWWRYAFSVVAYLLSMLSKSAFVTLPVVWLALDWWQRGRIGWRDLLRVSPFVLIVLALLGIEFRQGHLEAEE